MITTIYYRDSDTLDITLGPARGRTTTEEVRDGVLLDFDKKGRLVSVEIHQASARYPVEELEKLDDGVVWLSLVEAAEESKGQLTATTLRVMLNSGRIQGEKRGRDWAISRGELENYLESRSPRGRPSPHLRAAKAPKRNAAKPAAAKR